MAAILHKENTNFICHYITVKFFDQSFLPGDTPWVNELQRICAHFQNTSFVKLFTSLNRETIAELMANAVEKAPSYQPVNLFSYYYLLCPPEIDPDELLQALRQSDLIELAYLNGRKIPSSISINQNGVTSSTRYLDAAPVGIDGEFARTRLRAVKTTVKFIDIEQGWHCGHELAPVRTFPLSGISKEAFCDHGTAVIAIIVAQENNAGAGIVPGAEGYIISQWRPDGLPNEADAILTAITYLAFGDILLIESQAFHPDTGNKLWPAEIQQAVFEVIRLATALGIIVVEAAANGHLYLPAGNDLDSFAADGKNILCTNSFDFRDSGAILVASAFTDNPHRKIPHSNYGSRINCYASGEPSGLLSHKINGTSAAAAVIAGAAIAVQTFCEAEYSQRLGPAQMRKLLSDEKFGTPSHSGHAVDKIGVMPDLKNIFVNALNIFTVEK